MALFFFGKTTYLLPKKLEVRLENIERKTFNAKDETVTYQQNIFEKLTKSNTKFSVD